MIAGRLTDFITLLQPSTSTDRFGSPVIGYTPVRRVRAEVVWKSGSSSVDASEVFPNQRLEFIIRSAHPVDTSWRISYGSDTYYVGAIEKSRVKAMKRLICDKINE